MSVLARLFGRAPRGVPSRGERARPAGLGVTATRGQLVRMAHRDMLRRYGIPEEWVDVEVLTSRSSRGELGVHARIIVKSDDGDLIARLPQLLELHRSRLAKLDPSSPQWLCGSSVRFDLPGGGVFEPMPPIGFWNEPQKPPADGAGRGEDESARDWLDRMFAASPRAKDAQADFRPTQPMYGPGER